MTDRQIMGIFLPNTMLSVTLTFFGEKFPPLKDYISSEVFSTSRDSSLWKEFLESKEVDIWSVKSIYLQDLDGYTKYLERPIPESPFFESVENEG